MSGQRIVIGMEEEGRCREQGLMGEGESRGGGEAERVCVSIASICVNVCKRKGRE
jgi:hypothetical protein